MKELDTAFRQLEFAWKLYNYALGGSVRLEELDKPLTFQEGYSMLVLQGKLLHTPEEMILAFENNLNIIFGAAAMTLNRYREAAGIGLADPILTEVDQFSAALYQIRNAFAHDFAEPRWAITDPRYARAYEFGGIRIDLTYVGTRPFEYGDIGGPESLFWMKHYVERIVQP